MTFYSIQVYTRSSDFCYVYIPGRIKMKIRLTMNDTEFISNCIHTHCKYEKKSILKWFVAKFLWIMDRRNRTVTILFVFCFPILGIDQVAKHFLSRGKAWFYFFLIANTGICPDSDLVRSHSTPQAGARCLVRGVRLSQLAPADSRGPH